MFDVLYWRAQFYETVLQSKSLKEFLGLGEILLLILNTKMEGEVSVSTHISQAIIDRNLEF